jgi:hypothetical protein
VSDLPAEGSFSFLPVRWSLPAAGGLPAILSCPQKSALVNPKNAKSLIHPLTTQINPIVFAQKVLTSAQNALRSAQNLFKTSALLLIFVLTPFRR